MVKIAGLLLMLPRLVTRDSSTYRGNHRPGLGLRSNNLWENEAAIFCPRQGNAEGLPGAIKRLGRLG
jgi:hypothetical protein